MCDVEIPEPLRTRVTHVFARELQTTLNTQVHRNAKWLCLEIRGGKAHLSVAKSKCKELALALKTALPK